MGPWSALWSSDCSQLNGAIRIDIFDGDQRQIGGQRPNVVMMNI